MDERMFWAVLKSREADLINTKGRDIPNDMDHAGGRLSNFRGRNVLRAEPAPVPLTEHGANPQE
jgi:hypothetical protein